MKSAHYLAIVLGLILIVLSPRVLADTNTAMLRAPSYNTNLGVQAFLDNQPGVLKNHSENGQTAATIIEDQSLYYSLSPHLHLALLETTSSLLSDPNPPAEALRKPYSPAGPEGFAAHLEWASQEIRSGLGPYPGGLTIQFTDGSSITLDPALSPELVAIQRFLSLGRTQSEWQALVVRFDKVFAQYFTGDVSELFSVPTVTTPPAPPDEAATTTGFLHLPWPAGTRVHHLAYFDHVYPTVDSMPDNNDLVMTYMGEQNVQYNTHDGHDYTFPDQLVGTPILAAAPGVAFARTHRGNGVVILHDNGYETVYWHLNGFDARFNGLIDSGQGVWVDTGAVLGTSGSSGFTVGTPHLHFEVRHHGRQVDPYGWYGIGPDPCAAYAGCAASTWLWHESLRGTYDFTPPGETAPPPAPPASPAVSAAPSAPDSGASAGADGGANAGADAGANGVYDLDDPAASGAVPPAPPADPLAAPADPAAAPGVPADQAQRAGQSAQDTGGASVQSRGAAQAATAPAAIAPALPAQLSPTRTELAIQLPTSIPVRTATPTPSSMPTPTPDPALLLPTPDLQADDQRPPVGTLSINPPADLLLYVDFDERVLQRVGQGVPVREGPANYASGYPDQDGYSLDLPPEGGLIYPTDGNLDSAAGTISLWARVPENFPPNTIERHYLFAASANPADGVADIYTGTLALRRDLLGPDGAPRWDFWTTPQSGEPGRDDLAVPDTLDPGWHHFAITWDAEEDSKALYIDGVLAASADDVTLPEDVGPELQLGRFTYDGSQSGMLFDNLAIFKRALSDAEIAQLANPQTALQVSATVVNSPTLTLDTNASDEETSIVVVQLGRNGELARPNPYYDGFTWELPPEEGPHTMAARYIDRGGNETTITQTVQLDLPPRGSAVFTDVNTLTPTLRATLAISATDLQPPISMQISDEPDFDGADWQPLQESIEWEWDSTGSTAISPLYIRFRDASGLVSRALLVSGPYHRVYISFVSQSTMPDTQPAADARSVPTPGPSVTLPSATAATTTTTLAPADIVGRVYLPTIRR